MSRLTALKHRGVLIAAGTVVTLAAGGGATAAFADGTPTPAPSSSAATCEVHVGALLRSLPADLKADLKALRAEKKGDRADERKAIRQKALSGAYGARAEHVAKLFAHRRAAGLRDLPAALKTDLAALRKTAPKSDERRTAAQQIVQKALDGAYGEAIMTRATTAQTRVQAHCKG